MQFFKGGARISHFGLKRNFVWLASKKCVGVFYVMALHLPSDRSSIDSDSQRSRQGPGFVNVPSHGHGQFPGLSRQQDTPSEPTHVARRSRASAT